MTLPRRKFARKFVIVTLAFAAVDASIPRSSGGTVNGGRQASPAPSSVRSSNKNVPPSFDEHDDDRGERRERRDVVPLSSGWTPSPNIDEDGFLVDSYRCIPGEWEGSAHYLRRRRGSGSGNFPPSHRAASSALSSSRVLVRQVPGDGNCLFHSVAACLARTVNGTHVSMASSFSGGDNDDDDDDDDDGALESPLRKDSSHLRRIAVHCLRSRPRRRLFLQGDECVTVRELVDAAAAQYDITGEEYCDIMERDSYWGGGPEIVALCNVLRRPIHVYELVGVAEAFGAEAMGPNDDEWRHHRHIVNTDRTKNNKRRRTTNPDFCLRRMAAFGSPKFDGREPLRILSADSRFPDVAPRSILANGNHFLAMFPLPALEESGASSSPARRRRVRGGATSSEEEAPWLQEEEEEENYEGSQEMDVFGSHDMTCGGNAHLSSRPWRHARVLSSRMLRTIWTKDDRNVVLRGARYLYEFCTDSFVRLLMCTDATSHP